MWLTKTNIKVFSLADVLLSASFMAHPVHHHRYHQVRAFSVMDVTLVACLHSPGLPFASTLFKVAFVQNTAFNKYKDFYL